MCIKIFQPLGFIPISHPCYNSTKQLKRARKIQNSKISVIITRQFNLYYKQIADPIWAPPTSRGIGSALSRDIVIVRSKVLLLHSCLNWVSSCFRFHTLSSDSKSSRNFHNLRGGCQLLLGRGVGGGPGGGVVVCFLHTWRFSAIYLFNCNRRLTLNLQG